MEVYFKTQRRTSVICMLVISFIVTRWRPIHFSNFMHLQTRCSTVVYLLTVWGDRYIILSPSWQLEIVFYMYGHC